MRKPLTLHEILEELEKTDDGDFILENIIIFSSYNANYDNTDEDSGEEGNVSINNLPGSQVWVEAEIENIASSYGEDDVPSCSILKGSGKWYLQK